MRKNVLYWCTLCIVPLYIIQYLVYWHLISKYFKGGAIKQALCFLLQMFCLVASDTLTYTLEIVGTFSQPGISLFIFAILLPTCDGWALILRLSIVYGVWSTETQEKEIEQYFRDSIPWLYQYPLNPAYLVVEGHEDLNFEVDIGGIFH